MPFGCHFCRRRMAGTWCTVDGRVAALRLGALPLYGMLLSCVVGLCRRRQPVAVPQFAERRSVKETSPARRCAVHSLGLLNSAVSARHKRADPNHVRKFAQKLALLLSLNGLFIAQLSLLNKLDTEL